MPRKKVLITVTTYPLPSRSYDELVCTAGVLENGDWIRIYPVPLKFLKGLRIDGRMKSYKYTWIELDLKKRTDDFRPESHSPKDYSFKDLVVHDSIDTHDNWCHRKKYCLSKVYDSMDALIKDSHKPKNISLAAFKPKRILDFYVKKDDKEWKKKWKDQISQLQMTFGEEPEEPRQLIPKVPYKFYYKFLDSQDTKRNLMIEDWEIGALYWNCLRDSDGDENRAIEKVRQKYFTEFNKKDLYLFMGTTMQWHTRRASNPFVIIGVFYPPKDTKIQMKLDF
jgi:hypothetical protein